MFCFVLYEKDKIINIVTNPFSQLLRVVHKKPLKQNTRNPEIFMRCRRVADTTDPATPPHVDMWAPVVRRKTLLSKRSIQFYKNQCSLCLKQRDSTMCDDHFETHFVIIIVMIRANTTVTHTDVPPHSWLWRVLPCCCTSPPRQIESLHVTSFSLAAWHESDRHCVSFNATLLGPHAPDAIL